MKKEKFIYEEKYSHPYQIALNLTNDCNLACRYCFVEQKPEYMTLDIAIKAVEYMMNNLKLHKEVYKDIEENRLGNIWFFGGEPLLCFNSIIKPLIKYCEEKNYIKDINFSLTTNGTLLDKEKIDFFNTYKIFPMLSIDGAPRTQDYNRPCKNCNLKSSKMLEDNIPYLLKIFPETMFRATIYAPTIEFMFENYLYAESFGFKYISFTPDTRQITWSENEYNKLEEQLENIFAYRLWQYRNNYLPMNFNNLTDIYSKILRHDIYSTNIQLNNIKNIKKLELIDYLKNCGLGTYSASIDFKGDIYTCQERPTKDNKNLFILGNINNNINKIDYYKHKIFLEDYLNQIFKTGFQSNKKILCNSCLLKYTCVKSCVSTSKDLYNNYITINEDKCKYEQIILKLALNTMDILVKEKNKIFFLDLLTHINQYQIFNNLLEEGNYF